MGEWCDGDSPMVLMERSVLEMRGLQLEPGLAEACLDGYARHWFEQWVASAGKGY